MNDFTARFTFNSREGLWYIELTLGENPGPNRQTIHTRAKTAQQSLDRALMTRLQMLEVP